MNTAATLERITWGDPLPGGGFRVDDSIDSSAITPLLGNEEFGLYRIGVPPGESFDIQGGDQFILPVAGTDGTLECDGNSYDFELGECGIFEPSKHNVAIRAGKTALILFGVGDRRLQTDEVGDPTTTHQAPRARVRWADPQLNIYTADSTPNSWMPMINSGGIAKQLDYKEGGIGGDVVEFQEGTAVKEHEHDMEHVLIVGGGKGIVEYRGEPNTVDEGGAYLIPTKVPHAIYNPKGWTGKSFSLLVISSGYRAPDSKDRMRLTATKG